MESKFIADILTESGIKPSYPRIQVYKYLDRERNHPTVDFIYQNLIDEMPTLSKTTIYNTLKLFEESGLVKSIFLEDSEKRYEIVIDAHSHFRCEKCGNIYDIPYGEIDLLPDNFKNFKVKEKTIFLSGICENCMKNTPNS